MDKYTVINYLAKGKFGDVQLAGCDNKYYALKIIPINYFQRDEIFILKHIRGLPGVVQYVEHFFTDDSAVIVTEYCSGDELFNKISLEGEFTEDYDLKFHVSGSNSIYSGQTIIFSGEIEKVSGSGLTFKIRGAEPLSGIKSSTITLSGKWQADKNNRLTFLVSKPAMVAVAGFVPWAERGISTMLRS